MAATNVRVLGRNYRIIRKELQNEYGVCDNTKGTITIATGQDSFGEKDTLLHEIMHAILHQQGYHHAYKLEESFVRPLATGIITVLQDNPALAKALIAKVAL